MISFSQEICFIYRYYPVPQEELKNTEIRLRLNGSIPFWSLSEDMRYDVILILIYTGVRASWRTPRVEKEGIHLDEQWFQVTCKTERQFKEYLLRCISPFFRNGTTTRKQIIFSALRDMDIQIQKLLRQLLETVN